MQRRRFRNPLQHRIHVDHHGHKVSQLQLTAAESLRFLNKDGRQLIGIGWIIEASARRAGNAFQNGHIVVVRKHGHGGNRHLIVDKLLQQLRRRRRGIAVRDDDHVAAGGVRLHQRGQTELHGRGECSHVADRRVVNDRNELAVL